MSAKSIEASDSWVDRIIKLIPTEAIGLFVAIQALISAAGLDDDVKQVYTRIITGLVAVFVPIFLYRIYGIKLWSQYFIAIIGFLLWAYNINPDAFGSLTAYPAQEALVAAIAVTVFTVIGPMLLPKTQP
jgi:hypothetical protein